MRTKITALVVTALIAARLSVPSAATFPNDEKTIVSVLNRIGFGPRPGDVERVRKIGLERYIDEQLHPARISDPEINRRVDHLTTINLTSKQIAEQYERPLLEARRERKQDAAAANSNAPQEKPDPAQMQVQQRANGVIVELSEQKVLRAIYSDRQLQEVLTDFWFNHFNVDARKGRDRFLLTEYERETIRPHVLGNFRELLGTTAKSPAMLFYLDNWLSADPNGLHPGNGRQPGFARQGRPRARFFPPPSAGQPQRPQQTNNRRNGLNENYARELMELHTLGVDGGYTQKDVTEVARAFTGWTIDNPRQGGEFHFEPRIHDEGEKVVLGHKIKAGGGASDGEQVLDILASQPSTATFISTKLARRFVSDTPPPALVDRLAARFRESNGNLTAVMMLLLTSPEFLSPDIYRAKVKTPFEFVVSSVRATGADIVDARPLVRSLQEMGMPLYQCQPPTGYKDSADAWTNTGALVSRMNFALTLTSSRMSTSLSLESWQTSVDAALGHDLSEATRATVAKAATPAQRIALVLGSPEFQRR